MSAQHHLTRRHGVFYYRRRVPLHLVQTFGKSFIQFSLKTTSLKEAKKRRAAEDLKWSAQFDAAESQATNTKQPPGEHTPSNVSSPLSETEAIRLVQQYVQTTDLRRARQLTADPPASEDQRHEMLLDAEMGAHMVRDRSDPRGHELVDAAARQVLASGGRTGDDLGLQYAAFAEWVRRGLLELDERHLSRIRDQHGRGFIDSLFDPNGPPPATFGEVANDFVRYAEDEAQANGISQRSREQRRTRVALVREIIGENTRVESVDFDTCQRARRILAEFPANREQLYPTLSIQEAIDRAAKEGRSALSTATQRGYLAALRDILDLAAKKRLIAMNPAEGLTPLKRETVSASAKRLPFTPEQLTAFFNGEFYRSCADHAPPYKGTKQPWRFWLPLICLFMGLRPNEACQMAASDVRKTSNGTWYVDITASDDEEEVSAVVEKTLKTASSRRKVPIHPELTKIGFLDFVEEQGKANGSRLFPSLKPDQDGNCAYYALQRFRGAFLPAEIKLMPRQTFYSFRHNFRDALRRINAPPDALQALGGWSQGTLTSDSYGDKSDPDYQIQFIEKLSFPKLSISHLYADNGGTNC